MQLCSKPRGARGIEPETFQRRGQLLSRPPTTGPVRVYMQLELLVFCDLNAQGLSVHVSES